jgi:hypothetical protein
MNKKLIRLTESDLHKIIKESVKRILNEAEYYDSDGFRFWGDEEYGEPADIRKQLAANPPKIPNFDRNKGYDFYNGKWMDGKDAINARNKDHEAWLKDKREKEEKEKKRKEFFKPYKPLLDELHKLADSCYEALNYEDEEGNLWGAVHSRALDKLRQGAIGMTFIYQAFSGDKHIVENGYKMASEALNELDDEEVNKSKIYDLLQQVKERILDVN